MAFGQNTDHDMRSSDNGGLILDCKILKIGDKLFCARKCDLCIIMCSLLVHRVIPSISCDRLWIGFFCYKGII